MDSNGNIIWEKDFGGLSWDYLSQIVLISDDGYLLSGSSYSGISGDKTEINMGNPQSWILKTDSLGNKQWEKTISTPGTDYGSFAIQTKDGCFALVNYIAYGTGGIGGYKTQAHWNNSSDYWIVKFCDSTLTTNIANTDPDSYREENEQLLFSPNPTEGKLTISSRQLAINTIEIYNVLGESVYEVAFDCRLKTVDCRLLPSGIYFVKAFTREKVLFGKVVKE